MCELILLRHGETDWNRQRRIQGTYDIPLNEIGRNQAQELSRTLAHIPFTAIYSSHLVRAKETAEIIHAGRGAILGTWEGLHELHFGKLEGMTLEEMATRYSDRVAHARTLSPDKRLLYKIDSQEESWLDAKVRLEIALHGIAQKHLGEKVLVITHGWVIRALVIDYAKVSWDEAHISNGEGAHFYSDGKKLTIMGFFR